MRVCVGKSLLLRQDMGLELSQAEKLAGMQGTSGWVYARGITVLGGMCPADEAMNESTNELLRVWMCEQVNAQTPTWINE